MQRRDPSASLRRLMCGLALMLLVVRLAAPALAQPTSSTPEYDWVIAGGRVIDPETGLDALRHVGIRNGRIAALSETPLAGQHVLDARGHVRLTDFGLSKEGINDNVSGAHSFCGTPYYVSPELIQNCRMDEVNRAGYSKDVDWWALGVLTYEMMHGEPPFMEDDQMRALLKLIGRDPRFQNGQPVVQPAYYERSCQNTYCVSS